MPDGKTVYSNCKNADLSQAYLGGANLTGVTLTGANLSQAYLGRANLTGVTLTGVTLFDAYLGGANLTGANLDSAIKCKTIFPWGEDNSGCKQKMTQNF